VAEHVEGVLARADADLVYAAGPTPVLREVAGAAERRGAWCQVALETPITCGTGLCQGCPVPVVGEDGVSRVVRGCVDGPVMRADRVDWAAVS
jgi:dihydroorotate dehydrogenase electron transfer subunit